MLHYTTQSFVILNVLLKANAQKKHDFLKRKCSSARPYGWPLNVCVFKLWSFDFYKHQKNNNPQNKQLIIHPAAYKNSANVSADPITKMQQRAVGW